MIKLTLDEVKSIQLDILKKVSEYCEKEGIQYFLLSGTLLGAVRHKGYIPWDDDVDICMPYYEYKRFIKGFDNAYPNIRVVCFEHDEQFYEPFAKIENTDTLLIEDEELSRIRKIGVNIDLFPFDIVDDRNVAEKTIKKNYRYYQLLGYKNISLGKSRSRIKTQAIYLIKTLFKVCNRRVLINRTEQNADRVSLHNGTYFCNLRFPMAKYTEIYLYSWFSDYVYLEFEGAMFRAPVGYKEFLEQRYGDYMSLPPLEKQVTHHSYSAFRL